LKKAGEPAFFYFVWHKQVAPLWCDLFEVGAEVIRLQFSDVVRTIVLHYTCVMKILLACLALLLALPAIADTCKYEDADGRVIYSNMPMKGAKKIACFGLDGGAPSGGGSRNGGSRVPRASQNPTPAGFPRVDSGTQKVRDDARRTILQEELSTEQKALEQARKDYAEGEANPETFRAADGKTMRNMAKFEEKMKKLQEAVDLHEKNIQMLQKELANIK
jgi:hypothetical protein